LILKYSVLAESVDPTNETHFLDFQFGKKTSVQQFTITCAAQRCKKEVAYIE